MPGIPPRHRPRFEAWLQWVFDERKRHPRRNPVSARRRCLSGPDPLLTAKERAEIRTALEAHFIERRGVLEQGQEQRIAFLYRENRWYGD